MKKILSFLLAVSMLIGAFALCACGNNTADTTTAETTAAETPATTAGTTVTTAATVKTTAEATATTAAGQTYIAVKENASPQAPLDDALRREIEKCWNGILYNYSTCGSLTTAYYGIYDGYVVFSLMGITYDITDVEIAGEHFRWNQGMTFWGYKAGTFTELRELYADGKISADSIKTIAGYHSEYADITEYIKHTFDKSVSDGMTKPELDDAATALIQTAVGGLGFDGDRIVPFGQYGDCYVFSLDRPLKYITDANFGDYCFHAYTPGYIYVYYNGQTLTLSEAYDAGYLTADNIKTISYYNADWLMFHEIFTAEF